MANHFDIKTIGTPTIESPIRLSKTQGDKIFNFVRDEDKILYDVTLNHFQTCAQAGNDPLCMEKAGPREKIFFDPATTKAALVTCGGLCPGLNNVIRGIVMGLSYRYGVQSIIGIPYGYEGFIPSYGHGFVELTPDKVKDIHQFGGTILGSSRGGQSVPAMVDTLVKEGVNILFTIGGDGTLRGADEIGEEIEKRGLPISVVGVPKTIDNDINLIEKCFGFETAFDVASPIIRDAHNEAKGAYNGIAIVKLMGRDSGFIAASAALSMPMVNFVLVPEIDFDLEGEHGFFQALKERLESRHHAVIVVAEGAGQHLFEADGATDASGNIRYGDIGTYLRDAIKAHFKSIDFETTIKYIDPSYIVRSAPANSSDSVFCNQLALHAVHGAMAGKTQFVVGMINNRFVYLPICEVVTERKKIDLEGELWFGVLESTGQPMRMTN